ELYLGGFEIDRAPGKSLLPELFRKVVEDTQLLAERTFTGLYYFLRFFVSKPFVRMDDCASKPFLMNLSLAIHFEHRGERQLVFIGAQGTQMIRQAFRQHRYGSINEVYRRCTIKCFLVEY